MKRRPTPRLASSAPNLGDLVLVECWCMTELVRVPLAEARAGQTRSCGLEACRE